MIKQDRLTDSLFELERANRGPKSELISQSKDLSVEHVMPEKCNNDWPFKDGKTGHYLNKTDPSCAERNDKTVKMLRNLKLLTTRANASSGNRSFSEKKKK